MWAVARVNPEGSAGEDGKVPRGLKLAYQTREQIKWLKVTQVVA